KDIPQVASIFKKELKAVLVKGRGNYLCHTRLMEAIDEEGLFAGEDHPLRQISRWAETSDTGDRADLSFWPEDGLWSRICSEAGSCLQLRCAYREKCFVMQMKKNCADANILVANHHILFSDLAARRDGAGYDGTVVLPPFNTIIFDEAHAIEASASSFFSAELVKFGIYRQLSRLYREKRDRKFGIVTRLQNLQGIPPALFKQIPGLMEDVRNSMEYADSAAKQLLGDQMNYRLVEDGPRISELIYSPLRDLEKKILTLTQLLKDIIDEIDEENRKEQAVFEAQLAIMGLSELSRVCSRFSSRLEEPDNIFWLEKGRSARDESFAIWRITPLNIAALMNEAVFEPYRCCVCVSATLTVENKFDFWKRRVGLSFGDYPAAYHIFPSPFPYEETALLGSPTDAPEPNNPQWQKYINQAVAGLLEASHGHALVLFTSYSSLRDCWDEVKPKLDKLGISALRQGDDERSRLLEQFKTDLSSVLFATDSFWEGVDAPGSTLQMVIITKLPFRVPTDPVQMARAEAIEKRGGNAFMELSLPEAVIRFKQGFGRLIRHTDDTGAVIVLDARLRTKRYGSMFVSSLPETHTSWKPLPELCADVQQFLQAGRKRAFLALNEQED
ncbi:MAG: ATP-dependent DNA helicase DinG, partial [Spirochaetes bacterium]|nr:ATP-dependent DNA helicase DinG [Spirochaetota bacterium]